jgi:hypothetical protein
MQEQLEAGQRLMGQERYAEAVDAFDTVLALAPREYTLAMKSLLGRRDAYAALDERALAGADNRREFAWGRGIRWPGWYIIAAILFRNEIVRGM